MGVVGGPLRGNVGRFCFLVGGLDNTCMKAPFLLSFTVLWNVLASQRKKFWPLFILLEMTEVA